jgi:serine/threonine-protein kinase
MARESEASALSAWAKLAMFPQSQAGHFMRAARLSGLIAAAWLALGLSALPAAAQYYGAIAYSPATGAMGWGFDYPTPEGAARTAIAKCAEYARDCQILVPFMNGCGVVATGEEIAAGGASPSRSEAERIAMRRCTRLSPGCTVQRWVCTTNSLY